VKLTELLQTASSLEEACELLGEFLHLDSAADVAVTQRAIADQKYALYLSYTRTIPSMQDKVLAIEDCHRFNNKPEEEYSPRPAISLVRHLTGSVASWAGSGFPVAKESALMRRRLGCQTCEFSSAAPTTMPYRGMAFLTGESDRVCTKCGCLIKRKTLLATERCPVQDPNNPELSRWGEPWK
jgi:hypothetical protein